MKSVINNWVDVILAIAVISSLIRGWRAGFFATIFSAIGFVGGGIAGLMGGLALTKTWQQSAGTFAAILALIAFGSWIGELLMRSFAKFFHGKVLFGPFKQLDSFLGAAFSIARTVVMAFIICKLLVAMPWGWAQQDIGASSLFKQMESHAPHVELNFSNLQKKTSDLLG